MKKITGLLSLAILTALFATGCATMSHGPNQWVEITSSPLGATVLVSGKKIGTTPMTATLSRKRAHYVTLEKEGYVSESVTLRTVPNEQTTRFIRFDIDEQLGAHRDLTPSSINVRLDPIDLPEQAGENAVSELASKVVALDERLEAREIRVDEHRYILSRLLEFYDR